MLDLFFDRNLLFKKVEVTGHDHLYTIECLCFLRVLLCESRNNSLMNLNSNFLLDLSTDWLDNFVGKCSVYLSLVIVNSDVWLLQMLYVPKHIDWIIQGHQKVIKLIRSFVVRHNHLKDEGEQGSDPVNEPTSSTFLHNLFPVGHNLESLAQVSDLTELLRIENLACHKIETMVDDSRSHVVMSSLMALINSGEQVHHVFKELASLVPLAHRVDALDDDLIYDFTRVPIDEHNPLVDDMAFGSEFYINGL